MTTITPTDPAAIVKAINEEMSKSLEARDASLIETLTKQYTDLVTAKVAELEAKMARVSLPGSEDATHKGQKFSVAKAALAIATRRWDNAHLEQEVFKAMQVAPDSAGGYLVPMQILEDQYLPLLKANSVVEQLGATILRGLKGIQTIQKQLTAVAAQWVSEGSEIAESDVSWGVLRMEPRALAAISKQSIKLMENSAPAADMLIRTDITEQLALARDLAGMKGTGTSGQPRGIVNAGTGLNTVTLSAPATLNQLWDMVFSLASDNSLRGRLGWAMSVDRMKGIAQLVDASGQDSERRVLASGLNDKILGYPWAMSNQLASTDAIFGDWSQLMIGEWSGLRLEASQEAGDAFAKLQVHIRGYMETDIAVARPISFCIHQ